MTAPKPHIIPLSQALQWRLYWLLAGQPALLAGEVRTVLETTSYPSGVDDRLLALPWAQCRTERGRPLLCDLIADGRRVLQAGLSDLAIGRALLNGGVPIDQPDTSPIEELGQAQAPMTALLWAARRSDDRWVRFLLEHGANPTATDGAGRTALHLACEGKEGEPRSAPPILTVLAAGVSPNQRDAAGRSPLDTLGDHLFRWSLKTRIEVAEALLAHGLSPHERLAHQCTPLHLFANQGVADVWLAAGADVHARDALGNTALHHAVWGFGSDVVPTMHTLISAGADLNAVNHDGDTAMMVAHETPAITALLKAGADPHHRNPAGDNAL